MIFSFFVALVLVKFRITKAEFFAEFGMHFLCISFSNAIIIGQPLIVAVLGDEAAVLAILTLFADEWVWIDVFSSSHNSHRLSSLFFEKRL